MQQEGQRKTQAAEEVAAEETAVSGGRYIKEAELGRGAILAVLTVRMNA